MSHTWEGVTCGGHSYSWWTTEPEANHSTPALSHLLTDMMKLIEQEADTAMHFYCVQYFLSVAVVHAEHFQSILIPVFGLDLLYTGKQLNNNHSNKYV